MIQDLLKLKTSRQENTPMLKNCLAVLTATTKKTIPKKCS